MADDSVSTGGPSFEQIVHFFALMNPPKPGIHEFFIPEDYITFAQARSILEKKKRDEIIPFIQNKCFKNELIGWILDLYGRVRECPSTFFTHKKTLITIENDGMVRLVGSHISLKDKKLGNYDEMKDTEYSLILFKKTDILCLCDPINTTGPEIKAKEEKTSLAQRRTTALALFLKHLIQTKNLEPTQLPFTTRELISCFNETHPKELQINNNDIKGFIYRAKSIFKDVIENDVVFSKNSQGGGKNQIKDILKKYPYNS